MARTTISATTITGITSDGYNLTDSSDFSTLGTGTGNGVKFTFNTRTIIVLKNDTGGAAVFTLPIRATGITDLGGSITDPTVAVANGKTRIIQPHDLLNQTDGMLYIDCDVAGKVLVLNV